eukprot:1148241-Pelagomonas_calceolata.AAC.1
MMLFLLPVIYVMPKMMCRMSNTFFLNVFIPVLAVNRFDWRPSFFCDLVSMSVGAYLYVSARLVQLCNSFLSLQLIFTPDMLFIYTGLLGLFYWACGSAEWEKERESLGVQEHGNPPEPHVLYFWISPRLGG